MSKLKVRSKNSPNIQLGQNIDASADEVEILCAQILYRFQRLNFPQHALGILSMNGNFSSTCWAIQPRKRANKGANSLVFGKQLLATLLFVVDLLHGPGTGTAKWSVADSPVILASLACLSNLLMFSHQALQEYSTQYTPYCSARPKSKVK